MKDNLIGLGEIGPLDETAMKLAQDRLDSRTKPLGSLGKLEDLVVNLSGPMVLLSRAMT